MFISLLAVLDKSVSEASCLDLAEHSIGVCLNGICADLHTVIFLRRGRLGGSRRGKPGLDRSAEGIHGLAKLRKPVHDIAVITGDPQLRALRVADDVLFRQSILVAEIYTKLDSFLVNGRKIRGIG